MAYRLLVGAGCTSCTYIQYKGDGDVQKPFSTLKRLRGHEAMCKVSKRLKTEVAQVHLHHEKPLNKDKGKAMQIHTSNSPVLPLVDLEDAVEFVETEVALENDLEAGPSGSHDDSDAAEPAVKAPTPPTHSRRNIRLPSRYTDYLPSTSLRSPEPQSCPPSAVPQQQLPNPVYAEYRTEPDNMGLFRVYPTCPTLFPKDEHTIYDIVDVPTLDSVDPETRSLPLSQDNSPRHVLTGVLSPEITCNNLYSAFSSPTAGLLMCWQYSGSNMKSASELNHLWTFVQDPQFDPKAQATFSHEPNHGWRTSSVPIRLPHEWTKWAGGEHDPSVPLLMVDGVHHCNITEIIRSIFEDKVSTTFHMTPFEEYWQVSDADEPMKIYGEAYSSPVYLDTYREVNALPRKPGDDTERVVALLMLWSDAMQLSNFGDASLWPIYLFFGNQSKYTRGKPTAGASHHIAYVPTLPDDFQDKYSWYFQEGSSDDVYTHCKRELMQAIWSLLLDDKFMQAYQSGTVIRCGDGIVRRIFPRLFTYSADYPEKVLLSCIKFLGVCPCPRCLAEKKNVPDMGIPSDMEIRARIRVDNIERRQKIMKARKLIFKNGASINGSRVKDILHNESLVPTINSFSARLSGVSEIFNFFMMFVVDLLHEFELGIWKAVFTHLMRILNAVGGTSLQELNYRYRRVPTFGRGTIRRFHKNASAMKRLAARDFEDLLQCALPVFEGLIPGQDNGIVLDLLFDLATWHSYAKLRIHTEETLADFDAATTYLGKAMRKFQRTTCMTYYTTELPQEHAARGRRTAALAATKRGSGAATLRSDPKFKRLNLATYKYHALGDYPNTIRRYGTTDSYTTQTGELEHRRSKQRFPRSGKKKASMVGSIANQEAIERFIKKVNDERKKLNESHSTPRRLRTSPHEHYHMADNSRKRKDLSLWLSERRGDPAFKDFIPRLHDRLLARVCGLEYDGDEHSFSDDDRRCINISGNHLYLHKMLRVNYTTYDLRREQDTINPTSRADIMVLSHEDERVHPYWYARVVEIFHVMVQSRENPHSTFSTATRMNVLFVRWFCRDINYPSGWQEKRLHRLQFFDQENPLDAFGFIDPDSVVRGVHVIPAFGYGRTNDLLGPSLARRHKDDATHHTDHRYYYVNTFVDRDIFMRLRGGGIGHLATRDWNEVLRQDRARPVDDEDDDVSMRDEEGEGEVQEDIQKDGGMGEPGELDECGELDEWEGVMEGGEADENGDIDKDGDTDESESDESDEDDINDRVVADEGEELDDDIYSREGYGAL